METLRNGYKAGGRKDPAFRIYSPGFRMYTYSFRWKTNKAPTKITTATPPPAVAIHRKLEVSSDGSGPSSAEATKTQNKYFHKVQEDDTSQHAQQQDTRRLPNSRITSSSFLLVYKQRAFGSVSALNTTEKTVVPISKLNKCRKKEILCK